MRGEVFRVGRDPSNNVVLDGPEAAVVSALHMEIRKEGGIYRLFDLDSTNGTFVNGERVTETALRPPSLITLGPNGPQFQFELDVAPSQDLAQTLVASEALPIQASSPVGKVSVIAPAVDRLFDKEQEALLTEAVKKARQVRRAGTGGQTAMIMREMAPQSTDPAGNQIGDWFLGAGADFCGRLWHVDHSKSQETENQY